MMYVCIICFRTLQYIHVSDIGRSFEGWDLSPFLNKGVTIACFQTCGKEP